MEVGSLEIKGSLDTSDIIRGQRTISRGFETVNQKTQSSFSSMNLLAGSAAALGNSLQNIGVAAAGGLTLLAGMAPQLAPAFAKMKVETFKLSMIFGEQMRPAIDKVAESYGKFVNFLSQDTGLSNFTTDLITLVGAGGALSLLATKLLGIKNLGKIFIPIAVGIAVKQNLEGPASDLFTKGLDAIGYGDLAEGNPYLKSSEEFGSGLGKLATNLIVGAGTGAAAGAIFGGVGAIPGALMGAIGGAGYTIYEIVREDFFNDVDSSGR